MAKKLLARGGPHDEEFFKCFNVYLNDTLTQFQPKNDSTPITVADIKLDDQLASSYLLK